MKKQMMSFFIVLTMVLTAFASLPISVLADSEDMWYYSVSNGEATIEDCYEAVVI